MVLVLTLIVGYSCCQEQGLKRISGYNAALKEQDNLIFFKLLVTLCPLDIELTIFAGKGYFYNARPNDFTMGEGDCGRRAKN